MSKFTFNSVPVTVQKAKYGNGTLAIILVEEDSHEEYGVATVNLRSPFQNETDAFVDENNMPGIGKWLEENGLATPLHISQQNGFCVYPLYSFI